MAKCNVCGAPIAWKSVHRTRGDVRSRWEKMVPEMNPDGTIKKLRVPNGGGRTVLRSVPSDVKHDCAPVPTPENPMPDSSERVQCGAHHGRFICTLPLGHDGQHVAMGGNTECDRWPKCEHGFDPAKCTRCAHVPQSPPEPAPVPYQADDIDARVKVAMKMILDEYGIEPPPTRIEVKVPDGRTFKTDAGEIVHPCVTELVGYLARRRHVYAHGPAGSGKTFGAEQACKLVGLECAVITMPGMTYSKILGFAAADGEQVGTTLLDCFENGKVAILDEFDRTLPAVAAALNSMLENGRFAQGKRTITRHPDFCVVATGNTDLRGGTRVYTSAQPIDYATAARFAFVSWPYDQEHEMSLVRSVLPPVPSKALVAWVRKVRAMLTRDHIETVLCGPREAYRIAEDVACGVPMDRSAEAWVWRGLDKDTVTRLIQACPYPELVQ